MNSVAQKLKKLIFSEDFASVQQGILLFETCTLSAEEEAEIVGFSVCEEDFDLSYSSLEDKFYPSEHKQFLAVWYLGICAKNGIQKALDITVLDVSTWRGTLTKLPQSIQYLKLDEIDLSGHKELIHCPDITVNTANFYNTGFKTIPNIMRNVDRDTFSDSEKWIAFVENIEQYTKMRHLKCPYQDFDEPISIRVPEKLESLSLESSFIPVFPASCSLKKLVVSSSHLMHIDFACLPLLESLHIYGYFDEGEQLNHSFIPPKLKNIIVSATLNKNWISLEWISHLDTIHLLSQATGRKSDYGRKLEKDIVVYCQQNPEATHKIFQEHAEHLGWYQDPFAQNLTIEVDDSCLDMDILNTLPCDHIEFFFQKELMNGHQTRQYTPQDVLSKLKKYQYIEGLRRISLNDIQYYHRIPILSSLMAKGISFQANTKEGEAIIAYAKLENICRQKLLSPNEIHSSADRYITTEIRFQKEYRTLDLRSMNLYELPELIYAFSDIEVLRLNSNKLEKLPESIALLKNLKFLDLEGNRLKSLPYSLGTMQNLRYLYLQRNKRLHTLPFTLGMIPELRLYNENITKAGISSFRELPQDEKNDWILSESSISSYWTTWDPEYQEVLLEQHENAMNVFKKIIFTIKDAQKGYEKGSKRQKVKARHKLREVRRLLRYYTGRGYWSKLL